MTLEEAIKHCKEKETELASKGCFECAEVHQQLAWWLTCYKRVRDAEPCEDCISRSTMWYYIQSHISGNDGKVNGILRSLSNGVRTMPGVKPKPKTGKWERWIDMKSTRKYLYKCSVCDATVFSPHPYCSECGSRMEVEE